MNVAYVNPFITGTREVFEKMLHLTLSVGKAQLKDPGERLHKLYKVSVAIGLSGGVAGILVLNLSEPVALNLASALASTPFHSLNSDCLDALGEIASMLTGCAKKLIPAQQINITVPKLMGTSRVVYPAGLPILLLPFDTPAGRFALEVAMN